MRTLLWMWQSLVDVRVQAEVRVAGLFQSGNDVSLSVLVTVWAERLATCRSSRRQKSRTRKNVHHISVWLYLHLIVSGLQRSVHWLFQGYSAQFTDCFRTTALSSLIVSGLQRAVHGECRLHRVRRVQLGRRHRAVEHAHRYDDALIRENRCTFSLCELKRLLTFSCVHVRTCTYMYMLQSFRRISVIL